MTGSIVARQNSSTLDNSSHTGSNLRKFRRCLSVDNHTLSEAASKDDKKNDERISIFHKTYPDEDSGIEDLDHQAENVANDRSNTITKEDALPIFAVCEDQIEDCQSHPGDLNQDVLDLINDMHLAMKLTKDEKKEFCPSTIEVFHGEFAANVIVPLIHMFPAMQFYLYSEEEFEGYNYILPPYAFFEVMNAKAQFQCANPHCRRLWTSMRARISFTVTRPQPAGFVFLRIFRQNCQLCGEHADALWYAEEICRVMKKLSQAIFKRFSLNIGEDCKSNDQNDQENTKYVRNSNYDFNQRSGKMRAPHDARLCEACLHGLCYK